jgi:hypothetical protein
MTSFAKTAGAVGVVEEAAPVPFFRCRPPTVLPTETSASPPPRPQFSTTLLSTKASLEGTGDLLVLDGVRHVFLPEKSMALVVRLLAEVVRLRWSCRGGRASAA